MTSLTERLQKELEEATSNRDTHVSTMAESDSFSQQNMDRLNALQKLVADAKIQIEKAEVVSDTPEDAVDEMCVVTLIRGGKNDRCVQIPTGTSMQDLLTTLSETESGWEASGLTFKQRVGVGQTAEMTSLTGKIGPGNHEFFVTPKVAGGVSR